MGRQEGDKIYIGENICITVVEIDRNKVRIGIEAPRSVGIARDDAVPEGFTNVFLAAELAKRAAKK